MSILRMTISYTALGEAMLDLAKSHMRVEYDRDDDYIIRAVSRAADFFERLTETPVQPATWSWWPEVGIVGGDGSFGYAVPFKPEPIISKVTDANALDVTARWQLRGGPLMDPYGPRVLIGLDGQPAGQITVAVKVGYTDPDKMPPGIQSFILEAAAWYYENREAAAMPGADGVPYLNQLLTAYWRPRA